MQALQDPETDQNKEAEAPTIRSERQMKSTYEEQLKDYTK